MTTSRTTARFRTAAVAAAAVLAIAIGTAGCSSSDAGGTSEGASGATVDDTTTTTLLEAFDGGDFYDVPEPLPEGPHGTLIRYDEHPDYTLAGTTTYRIMYLSESLQGDPIAVTGTATVPTGDAPEGGRQLVTISHGTTGIADECAPSKNLGATELDLVGQTFADSAVIAYSDDEGLGTPGRHPYLVGESEGRSAIDAIVAAGQLPDADPGTQLGIAGYSQGGHGAIWTSQVAAEWAPDLEVVGTFAGAPASETDVILAAAPRLPVAGFAYMMVAGFNAAYPEADPALFLTDEGAKQLDVVDEGCGREVISAFAGTDASELIRADGPSSDPWQRLGQENVAGQEKTNDAPTMIVHAQTDTTVPIIFSKLLQDRMCANGQVVNRVVLPDGNHTSAAVPAYQQAMPWLQAQFGDDAPATEDSCPTA